MDAHLVLTQPLALRAVLLTFLLCLAHYAPACLGSPLIAVQIPAGVVLNFQIAIVALRPKQFARPAILRNLNYQVLPVSVLLATTPIRRVRFARLVPTTATPVRQPLPA